MGEVLLFTLFYFSPKDAVAVDKKMVDRKDWGSSGVFIHF